MTGPDITDKTSKPPGVLPKNLQTWIVVGLAGLMVLVIALSGKNPPKRTSATMAPEPVIDPSASRIEDYRKRVDEEMRRLQQEQAQLAARRGAELSHPAGSMSSPAATVPGPRYFAPSPAPEEAWLRSERSKREYESLFASNIALSLRRQSVPSLAAGDIATPKKEAVAGPTSKPDRPGTEPRAETGPTDLKKYRLFEGTVIEAVLTNRLDGAFSGPANCMVTTNVYSHDGQKLLIPQGSRLLGEVKPVDKMGQERLAVTFHRLIMPDGFSVSLDQFRGLDQTGETGLQDLVNHHYMQIFGASIAIGAIAGLAQANTRYGFDESAMDAYRQGVASSLSQSSLHVLDRFLNVLPTFTIREGQRVKVLLASDLELPAYDNHQMSVDL